MRACSARPGGLEKIARQKSARLVSSAYKFWYNVFDTLGYEFPDCYTSGLL